jgi:hypothetical protein
MRPTLKAPKSRLLKLEHDKVRSNVASKINLRRYILALLTAGVIFANALSLCLYLGSFAGKKVLAKGGDTGNTVGPGRHSSPRH